MNTGVISIRYAKALYDYAAEHNAQAATYKSMLQLKEVLRKVKELTTLLKSPSLPHKKKLELLCSAVQPSSVFENFLSLVIKNGREDMLLYISYAYIDIYRRKNRVVAMKIATAVPMPESLLQKIGDIIKSHDNVDVEIKNVIDETIIGGFVCEANHLRLDASVRNQLSEIRKNLVKTDNKIV